MTTPLRVLIVEDRAADAELMVLQLEEFGFAVEWRRVETEADFIAALAEPTDVVLSDWRLPRFSGLRALETFKARGTDLPFIVVSGAIGEEAAIDVLRKGAADYVMKDRMTRLGQVVRRALDDQPRRREAAKAAAVIELQVAALTAAANGIVITDRDGMVEWVNPAFSALTGFTLQDALGKNPRALVRSGLHPKSFFTKMWETILAGDVWHGEIKNRKKDGTLYAEEQTITPVHDAYGEITHFVAIKQDITERKQHESELTALAEVSAAMRVVMSRAQMLPVVLDQLSALLHTQGAALALSDPETSELVVAFAQGAFASTVGLRLKQGSGLTGMVLTSDRAFSTPDVHGVAGVDPREVPGLEDGLALAVASAPLVAEGVSIGAIWLSRPDPFSASDVRLLRSVSDIAANAIRRETLHEETRQAAAALSAAYETTIEGWSHALDLRDKETEGHTLRVTEMTMRLARAAAIAEDELVHIRRGALLHDIGKMGVPDAILLKPGKLTDDEWVLMRMHPQFAWDLLHPIEFLRPALDIPFSHHEKWDGTGYPRGLKGEEIPYAARLFAVIDVWDALRSDRPYRPGWPIEKITEHIRALSGSHFDPRAVELFFATQARLQEIPESA